MTDPLTVLIVEDEPLIAMMLEDFIDGLGHRIGGVSETVDDAVARANDGGFDVAILDVHLRGGTPSWPVADALADRSVPFVLSTGGLVDPAPTRHADVPRLPKPFTMDGVRRALEMLGDARDAG